MFIKYTTLEFSCRRVTSNPSHVGLLEAVKLRDEYRKYAIEPVEAK